MVTTYDGVLKVDRGVGKNGTYCPTSCGAAAGGGAAARPDDGAVTLVQAGKKLQPVSRPLARKYCPTREHASHNDRRE